MSPELGDPGQQYLYSPAPPSSIVDPAGAILALSRSACCWHLAGETRDDAEHPTTQDSMRSPITARPVLGGHSL